MGKLSAYITGERLSDGCNVSEYPMAFSLWLSQRFVVKLCALHLFAFDGAHIACHGWGDRRDVAEQAVAFSASLAEGLHTQLTLGPLLAFNRV